MTEPLPLSLLNDFLYCPRRAALKGIEGWRGANVQTDHGDIVHEHADLAGYEVVKGVTLLRALPVWSERLGGPGKCDIVERRAAGSLLPVGLKVGPRRTFENDDVQVCAQALCLEEMFGVSVPRGAVFHADSKRRREIEFSADLRATTERTAADLQALLAGDAVPAAVYIEGRCEKCSLYEVCLPRLTEQGRSVSRATAALFQT